MVPVDFDAYVSADLATRAGDFVVDDAEQFEHYRARGYFESWPQPSRELGAEPRSDLRVSCSLGVGAVDAALAAVVLERARDRGVGIRVPG